MAWSDSGTTISTMASVGIGSTSVPPNGKLAIVGGGLTVGGVPVPIITDATIHITSSVGGYDRLLQMNPVGPSKPGLNLLACTDANGQQLWWSWGVNSDNTWRIQATTSFLDSNPAVIIDRFGNVTVPGDLVVQGRTFGHGDHNVQGNINVQGDVTLLGADCAERFDAAAGKPLEPGTVMVIDDNGSLCECSSSYAKTVAGIVSGAGEHRPAILLDNQDRSEKPRVSIALCGKVYCKVDAYYDAISIGDLLTTSSTPGHAMRASDQSKAFGAVLGKALKPLQNGLGLIPVLVALQ